jgi:transcriptional regulator with XRE-family HTH domain
MTSGNASRALRFLRVRRGWRQTDLGLRAGVSRELISRLERGCVESVPIGKLAAVVHALGGRLFIDVRWEGERLDRLMDAAHAGIVELASRRLRIAGWDVRPEVSFNHFGDRGRIDLLGWHGASRSVVVVEAKSRIGDVQETLGRLDVKVRLAPGIARDIGWGTPATVTPMLVVADGRTPRRVINAHAATFSRFATRGRAVTAWMHRPLPTSGLLWLTHAADSHWMTARRVRRRSDSAASRPM